MSHRAMDRGDEMTAEKTQRGKILLKMRDSCLLHRKGGC